MERTREVVAEGHCPGSLGGRGGAGEEGTPEGREVTQYVSSVLLSLC